MSRSLIFHSLLILVLNGLVREPAVRMSAESLSVGLFFPVKSDIGMNVSEPVPDASMEEIPESPVIPDERPIMIFLFD